MLILLVVFVVVGYGVFRLGKSLEPGQRVVLVLVALVAVAYLLLRVLPLLRPSI